MSEGFAYCLNAPKTEASPVSVCWVCASKLSVKARTISVFMGLSLGCFGQRSMIHRAIPYPGSGCRGSLYSRTGGNGAGTKAFAASPTVLMLMVSPCCPRFMLASS
jgi:hypothetical protein